MVYNHLNHSAGAPLDRTPQRRTTSEITSLQSLRKLISSAACTILVVGAVAAFSSTHAAAAANSRSSAPQHRLGARSAQVSSAFIGATTVRLGRTSASFAGAVLHAAGPAQPAAHHAGTGRAVPSLPSLAAPLEVTSFEGTDQSSAIANFGTDQEFIPPDPDLAVGPANIVETTNSTIYVYSKAGVLEFSEDINAFTGTAAGDGVTDPRIIYDTQSGRFFFSVLVYSPGCVNTPASEDFVAVSPSSNLSSGDKWNTFTWAGASDPGAGALIGDQPGLGVSDNIVAATQSFYTCGGSQVFVESEALMIQKSDLIAGKLTGHTAVDYYGLGFIPQPVQSLAPNPIQYVVWNQSDSAEGGNGTFGASSFTGTPEAQDMPSSPPVFYLPMTPTSEMSISGTLATPSAMQQGTVVTLQTDDDRFLNAVWSNGQIWTADDTTCALTGDTCLNIMGVSTELEGQCQCRGRSAQRCRIER